MKKTVFDLTNKEGVKIDKELKKTSYFKQYLGGYIYSIFILAILGLVIPETIIDVVKLELSPDILLLCWLIMVGFASLLTILFWFKRFDLVKQYYEEKCHKEEK